MPSTSRQMQTHAEIGYESKLFDTNKVHTIDIVMDDWEGFLSTCQSEEYTVCDVTKLNCQVGDTVTVTIYRAGQQGSADIALAEATN